MIPKKTYHFSVDDVFDSLAELTDKKINLFEQPFFAFLLKLHQVFGVNVGLHLFYQKKINGTLRTLKDVPDLKNQLKKENWLFFGPHALDYDTPPYAQSISQQVKTFDKIYKQIDRFAGIKKYTRYVRLQYYSESFELKNYFRKKGVEALFTTDRTVGSHRMPKTVNKKLLANGYAKYKGMNFIRTQFRVEFFAKERIKEKTIFNSIKKMLAKYGFIVFYTHEVDMANSADRKMARSMLDAVCKLSLTSVKKP